MALNWAIHAKNSLANVHGFTPYQLAIGYTSSLLSILINKPPVFEDISASEILGNNLNAMAAARRAFIESENSEKLRRAMCHNIRSCIRNKFVTGDVVYYKRNDSKKWKGPGTVIGHDMQQILIKHGGIYVRLHSCCTMLEKSSHKYSQKTKNVESESLDTVSNVQSTNEQCRPVSDSESYESDKNGNSGDVEVNEDQAHVMTEPNLTIGSDTGEARKRSSSLSKVTKIMPKKNLLI